MFVKLPDDDDKKKQPSEPSGKPNLTSEQLRMLKQRCEHDNVEFYYRATDKLKNYIVQGHPITNKLPEVISIALLEGKGVAVTRDMVYDWLSGKLDQKNAFILKHSEVHIENDPMNVIRTGL